MGRHKPGAGRYAIVLGALVPCTLGACVSERSDATGPEPGDGVPVAIEEFAYLPPELSVTVGESVVWTNRDAAPHTVTAEDGSFDSSAFGADESFRLTAEVAGEFPYFCTIHPFMRGSLRVEP